MLSKYLTKFIEVISHMIFENKIISDGWGKCKMALAFVFRVFYNQQNFFTAQLLLAVSISSLFLLPQQPSLHEHSPRWDRLVCVLYLTCLFFFYFFPLLSAEQGPLFTDGTSPTAALKIFSSLGRMLMKASAAGCYFRDTCVHCDWIFRGWGLLIFASRKRQ